MRCLALDVGDERIGVAISDSEGWLARPLEVIRRRPGPSSFLRIARLVAEHGVELVVVGLPLLPDGSEGRQAFTTRAYVAGLEAYLRVPIVFWDERGSTRQAEQILAENKRPMRRRKGASDMVAAAVLLQEYLNARSGGRLC